MIERAINERLRSADAKQHRFDTLAVKSDTKWKCDLLHIQGGHEKKLQKD